MPIYDFECPKCGFRIEDDLVPNSRMRPECDCGETMERKFNPSKRMLLRYENKRGNVKE